VDIANNSLKVKRSKAINMRYHWIRDRIKSKDLQVTWLLQGIDNFAAKNKIKICAVSSKPDESLSEFIS
jgi:hypothetical protein